MADPIEVGSVLGDTYEIVRLLGRGGMGAVWEARHLRLPGKRVAVKLLHGDRIADANVFARFRREAEIASRLGNPNIIEALDFNTLADGTPYIVLEYLEGQTLGARLRGGAMGMEETFAIVRQIATALAAAHRAGVVHRDLKPDNIFLCPTDSGGEVGVRVKILDFGISKIRDSQSIVTTDHTVLGTPQYMSPEQASAKHGEVDARTDQFALGAIVYEMLSGQAAFSGPTLVSVVYKVLTEEPEPLPRLRPQVPSRVTTAVEKALSKRAENRYPDIAGFVEALTGRPLMTLERARAAAEGHGDTDERRNAPTVPEGEAGRSSRPPRAAVAFAGGAFVVAVASLTALALRRPPPTPAEWTARHAAPPPRLEAPVPPPAAPTPAPSPPAPGPPISNPPAAAPPATVGGPPAAVVPVGASPATAATPGDRTSGPRRPGATAGGKREPRPPAGALPPEVQADLDAAEAALGAGDAGQAMRLARHSLLGARTPRAFALIARAACKQGDLETLNAQRPHLGPLRARVLRECRAAGLDVR